MSRSSCCTYCGWLHVYYRHTSTSVRTVLYARVVTSGTSYRSSYPHTVCMGCVVSHYLCEYLLMSSHDPQIFIDPYIHRSHVSGVYHSDGMYRILHPLRNSYAVCMVERMYPSTVYCIQCTVCIHVSHTWYVCIVHILLSVVVQQVVCVSHGSWLMIH